MVKHHDQKLLWKQGVYFSFPLFSESGCHPSYPGIWSWTQKTICLRLWSAGVKGVHHHTRLEVKTLRSHRGKSRQELDSNLEVGEAMEKARLWFALLTCLACFPIPSRDHPPRNCPPWTLIIKQWVPTLIIRQANVPQACLQWRDFLHKVPFSQMTLACITLTEDCLGL